MDEDHHHDVEVVEPFNDGADLCQQLMDRYAKSSAPQHRHLLATAAAMRSILTTESMPLTPPAYFAATVSAIDDMSSSASQTLDPTAVAALMSFLTMVLPLMPPQSISSAKASEAVSMLTGLLGREDGLSMSGVRAVVKCLGLLVGFCDLEDWGSIKLGFETLLKFSIDKRPKVRKCSQDCLVNVLKSLQSRSVIKEVSELVLSMLKGYMPLALELTTLGTPKNLEVLHMLNVVKLAIPFLSAKVSSKLLSEINKLMPPRFSALTRHVLQIIEAFFETSRVDAIVSKAEETLASLASYVSLGGKNPLDTVMSVATLLKSSLGILRTNGSASWINNLPLVCSSLAGLLTSDPSTESHAASILKELISQFVDQRSLLVDENQPLEDEGRETMKASALKSICSIFEDAISTCGGVPNEHILDVISALFLKLGGNSYIYMGSILLKLADLMTLASGEKSNTDHLQNCIGTAVIAMGPERLLKLVPISLNAGDFTCLNIWLVPILKNYVVGASLEYYMEHIMPLAKSFRRASTKVKKSITSQDLQAHAHDLLGLLPSFCRHPTDMYQKFGRLAEVLVTFLKDSSMHKNVAVALQVLVNQNKSVLDQKDGAGETDSYAVNKSVLEFGNVPTYSKKTAMKNIKALASCSAELLQSLTDLFIDSPPGKRPYLKDAIGCLASVTDSSIAKKIFISLLEKFQLKDDKDEFEKVESHTDVLADEGQHNQSTREKDAQGCVIMELASSLVEGAEEDLIDLIYTFIKDTFKTNDEVSNREAYFVLSRILEEHNEHSWFCSAQSAELIDLLLGMKSPVDIFSLRSRFASFQTLMIHNLKLNSEVANAKAFLILNEIIITLKDAKEEKARKAAYDMLLKISSSLRDSTCTSSDGPYQKLINMIMGYLSGASPHIKSGAVSVLSVLVYEDTDICLSMPDLVPSLLSLLQGKALEVIKAVLGFVKVLVSRIHATCLRNLLPDIVNAVLPWSPVSRHHFREKVTVIMEIMLRKCGTAAVQLVTPDKYKGFVKGIVESRQSNKRSSKEVTTTDINTTNADSSTNRMEDRKRKELGIEPEKSGSMEHRKRKRVKIHNSNELRMSSGSGDGPKRAMRGRQSDGVRSVKDRPERSGKTSKDNYNKGPTSGHKRKMEKTNMSKKDVAAGQQRPGSTSRLHKHKKVGRKQ